MMLFSLSSLCFVEARHLISVSTSPSVGNWENVESCC